MRRELQRAPLSIPGREVVQVLTEIPPGVASGWHVHPGEEIGYIAAGEVEMMVAGRQTISLVNVALMRWDADKRKRCGECARQPAESESKTPGSGAAIAAGSLLDAIPEAMILGFAAHGVAEALPPLALIGAFGFANFAEGLSSSAGMLSAGRSRRYVVLLWSGATAATTLGRHARLLALRHRR